MSHIDCIIKNLILVTFSSLDTYLLFLIKYVCNFILVFFNLIGYEELLDKKLNVNFNLYLTFFVIQLF